MITGGHSVIYSENPIADRAFLRDVLKLTNVDAGDGWLIFGLPPSEIAVHPSNKKNLQEFFFMCAEIETFIMQMKKHGIKCDQIQDEGWGLLTYINLPGGGKLGIYQPRHTRPEPME